MTDTNNPFKMISPNEEVPKQLKEKVIRDVNYIQCISDSTELFSVKDVENVQTLFKTEAGKEEKKVL